MECFVNYIGLSACGAYDSPASGIYINSLPGMSIESFDKIADADQMNYLGVWDDIQSNAIQQFYIDVRSEISKCYELSCDCDYKTLMCENIEELTQPYKYLLGIWALLFRINSNRFNLYTTLTVKQAQELKDHYQVEYEKYLKSAVLCMDVSSCDLCCGGNPQVVTWLP